MGYRVALFCFIWESVRKRDGERENKKDREMRELSNRSSLTKTS